MDHKEGDLFYDMNDAPTDGGDMEPIESRTGEMEHAPGAFDDYLKPPDQVGVVLIL